LVGTGRNHHGVCSEVARRRAQRDTIARRVDRVDVDALANRNTRVVRVALEIRDELVPQHERIRGRSLVGAARKLRAPVRGHEAEAVPAISPGLRDPPAFEHNRLDAEVGKLPADGQPRLPRAHNRHLHALGDHLTSLAERPVPGLLPLRCPMRRLY
jgi:hypothetical protein